jgi:hypothetical protein
MAVAESSTPTKPIIPAVAGLFTFCALSPYALVLCIEHYLDPRIRPKPISTHIATALALIGSLGWYALAFSHLPHMLGMFAGQPPGMHAGIGVMTWIATAIFLCWTCWRFVRQLCQRVPGASNPIEGAE